MYCTVYIESDWVITRSLAQRIMFVAVQANGIKIILVQKEL